ncbi:hypothetical protein BC628DRAFT_1056313 [Trametes gibbosa]|nr:hypothetical protein BC628DRAFT_1056313 [Trametes gibbosa]
MDALERKRDSEGTVVTFFAPDRTFERLYKGQSLEDMKSLVRTKLGLAEDASIRFSRLHGGRHIDLEDDDDFEAFRHIARYATTLDVSVFVGNSSPPMFTQQSSQAPSDKHRKKTGDSHPSTTFLEPASGRSTPTSTAAPTSTLDANGVPRRKRKRRDEPRAHQSADPESSSRPEESSEATAEDPSRPRHSKKSHKSVEVDSVAKESVTATVQESPTPVVGTKRKRHASLDLHVATSNRPLDRILPVLPSAPRSPPPSVPEKKKRKKDKRAQATDDVALSNVDAPAPAAKPDKKGKRKAPAQPEPEQPQAGDIADIEDNVVRDKATKKAGKEKVGQRKQTNAAEGAPLDVQEASTTSREKKRKRKEVSSVADVTAPSTEVSVDIAPVALPQEHSSTALARKSKKKRKSTNAEVESTSPPEEASLVLEGTRDISIEPTENAKRKRSMKSKVVDLVEVPSGVNALTITSEAHTLGPSNALEDTPETQQTEKKRKRRKTVGADTSLGPDAPTISSTAIPADPVPDVTPEEVASTSTSASAVTKRGRKKSIAPAAPQAVSDSVSAMAAVQAAVQAVLARNSHAAAASSSPVSATEPPSQSAPELVLPGRKRKTGNSKLRQAWGPEDISVEEHPSASLSIAGQGPLVPSLPPDASISRSASLEPSETPVQSVKGKGKGAKARPSSAPACPICEKASVHSRTTCPVVEGGPESIRNRIAQLKQSGDNEELVEELEVLLKEAQRRRKSVGGQQVHSLPGPHQLSSAAASSAERTPSPVFPLSAALFAARSAPLPRVPAGSEISEVVVESKDEGSSNDGSTSSSSSDEDDDSDDAADAPAPKPPSELLPNNVSVADLSSIDLESLLRGPVRPRGSILDQIPSDSSSEDGDSSAEDNDEAPQEEDVDLEEEEKHDRAYRRMSRKFARAASSSDDEPEPELELEPDMDDGAAEAEAANDDSVDPLTIMDTDSNDTVGQGPDVEAGAIASKRVATPQDVQAESEKEQPVEAAATDAQSKAATDQGYASDAGEVAASPSILRGRVDSYSESGPEDQVVNGGEESLASRGGRYDVTCTADSDQGASPHSISKQLAEDEEEALDPEANEDDEGEASHPGADEEALDPGANEDEYEDDGVSPEGPEVVPQEAEGTEEPMHESSASEDDEEVEKNTTLITSAPRAPSPELGEPEPQPRAKVVLDTDAELERTSSPPPLRQQDSITTDADVDMTAALSAHPSELDLRPEDHSSDPIESLGSFADISERRQEVDDDPIEDADAESEPAEAHGTTTGAGTDLAGLHEGTPPPAVPRTPGTVSRMKDRHGRLTTASPSKASPSLSHQLLGALMPTVLNPEVEAEAQIQDPASVPKQQDEPQETAYVPSEHPQEADEEADEVPQLEGRPRRTTRVTRRASAMSQSSAADFPASTPTPAPVPPPAEPAIVSAAPKRRTGRLTADEKAARDAEKKAERERKAAERQAERDAKAASKRVEREAKEAVRRAEKEAREAVKRAAKEEKEKAKVEGAPKRGRGRSTRGRGAATKPTSTRSRSVMDVEAEDVAEDERIPAQAQDTDGGPSTSTPGFSKVAWATLPATQPRTQTESIVDVESSMVDELQPSSPRSRGSRSPRPISRTTNTTENDEADVSREVTITQDRALDQADDSGMPFTTPKPNGRVKEPLFIPSSSQFLSTPFPADGLPESTPRANGHTYGGNIGSDGDDSDQRGVDDASQDTLELRNARPNGWRGKAPYPRLTDIASQTLFDSSQIPSPMLFPSSQSQPRRSNTAYGRRDDDDDDDDDDSEDDSGSGSDSDVGAKKSQIPRERRAGAGVQKKRKSLLSLA